MKKSLRFASAALAVALAASCAAPAFAAGGSSFTKSETVYAVMNADGSIQSTTVSEHVYSASGLSNVTDQSTLTNIQNTESSAEFTQNGDELVCEGECPGTIAFAPMGENGFGYDPVFFVPDKRKTFAQLTAEEKSEISHRGKALRAFKETLKNYLAEHQ